MQVIKFSLVYMFCIHINLVYFLICFWVFLNRNLNIHYILNSFAQYAYMYLFVMGVINVLDYTISPGLQQTVSFTGGRNRVTHSITIIWLTLAATTTP